MEYEISATRIDAHRSNANCKEAEILLDTDVEGRVDAFNPAELFLAAIAACILKNIERLSPMVKFDYRGVHIKVKGERQNSPPKMVNVKYEVEIDTDEDDRKLELMHLNIRKFGTIYNTVMASTELAGTVKRSSPG